ncbi:MAG: hypothetical protein KBS91_02855, partial [Firmicutes bacterium]|nr:hypothetical protein [Candidatus Caballimonas caccae]
ESEDITLSKITYTGFSFVCWKNGDAETTVIKEGSFGDITLTAEWVVYGLKAIEYNTDKTAIKESDTISAELFNASCIDTDGNPATVTATYSGVKNGGNTITVKLVAEIGTYKKQITIQGIKVYANPTLSIDEAIDYFYIQNGLSASWFKASAVDSFGNNLTVTATIDGEYNASDIVTVLFKCEDCVGNNVEFSHENVRVLIKGTPTISNPTKTDFKVSDVISISTLGVVSYDALGGELTTSLSLKSGEQVKGTTMTYTLSATDVCGNTSSKDITVKIYDTPTICIDRTNIKFTDSINVATFNAVAKDSFGNNLSISISFVSGNLETGGERTYNFSVKDNAGNILSVDKTIKVYKQEEISLYYDGTCSDFIKKSSKGEEFNAFALDSFGEPCDITIVPEEGFSLSGGNIINLRLVATDKVGNSIKSEIIERISVYDIPTCEIQKSIVTVDTDFSFLFIVKDSFGDELYCEVTPLDDIVSDTIISLNVKSSEDIAGNVLDTIYSAYISSVEKDLEVIGYD